MKFLFLFLFLILISPAFSTVYYVDSTLGNDSNSGLTEGEAFNSISKINSLDLHSGDNILFKRGEIWREQLIISTSGGNNNPILYGAYGSGNRPIINPSNVILNWSHFEGDIYVANVTFDVNLLIVNDDFYNIAHYPNEDYINIAEDSQQRDLFKTTDIGLSESQVIDSNIRIRNAQWYIQEFKVNDYDSSSKEILIHKDSAYDLRKDYGYFLTNKFWMLDQEREWYYNTTTKQLFVWFENSETPENNIVEVPFNDSGILSHSRSNIIIEDLEIKNVLKYGIEFNSGVSNYKINNVNISNSGSYGISTKGSTSSTSHNEVKNSFFQNNLQSGIRFDYTSNLLVENNFVINNGINKLPIKVFGSIHARGENISIINNKVFNGGYTGIHFLGENILIEKNIVNNTCITLDDCAGIYTWGNMSKDSIIRKNIISNAIGNTMGVPYNSISNGVYIDDRANNMTVEENTIYDVKSYGIFLHNTQNNTIKNNVVYNAKKVQFIIMEDTIIEDYLKNGSYIEGNIIYGNTFCAINDSQLALEKSKKTPLWDSKKFGKYYDNSYCYTNDFIQIRENEVTKKYDFDSWIKNYLEDLNSINLRDTFEIIDYVITNYSKNLIINGDFIDSKNSWSNGWSSEPNHVFTSWKENCEIGFGGCLESYTDRGGEADILTNSDTFPIVDNSSYLFNFILRGDVSESVLAIIRNSGNPNYNSVGFNKDLHYNTTPKYVEELFVSTDENTNARLDFQSNFANAKIQLDNISLRRVNLSLNDKTDDILFLFNSDFNDEKTFNLNQNMCDLNENIFIDSIDLESFESIILFSCFCNNDNVCNNYENYSLCPNDCTFQEESPIDPPINDTPPVEEPPINDSEPPEINDDDGNDNGGGSSGGGSSGGTTSNPPSIIQIPQGTLGIENKMCQSLFSYTSWSECILGKQTRVRSDDNLCLSDSTQTRICKPGITEEELIYLNAIELFIEKSKERFYLSSFISGTEFFFDEEDLGTSFIVYNKEEDLDYLARKIETTDSLNYYSLEVIDQELLESGTLEREGLLEKSVLDVTQETLDDTLSSNQFPVFVTVLSTLIFLCFLMFLAFYIKKNKKKQLLSTISQANSKPNELASSGISHSDVNKYSGYIKEINTYISKHPDIPKPILKKKLEQVGWSKEILDIVFN